MSAYRRELRRPEHNSYYVLRAKPMQPAEPHELRVPRGRFLETILPARRGDPQRDLPTLAGYVGMWQMYDETHITTIAVDPVYRGRGLGELLAGHGLCGRDGPGVGVGVARGAGQQ